jgi:hypothetical protein
MSLEPFATLPLVVAGGTALERFPDRPTVATRFEVVDAGLEDVEANLDRIGSPLGAFDGCDMPLAIPLVDLGLRTIAADPADAAEFKPCVDMVTNIATGA